MATHDQIEKDVDEEEDLYETLLEKSGCAKLHYALQDCYFEHNDWRKCQKEMQEFKKCVEQKAAQKIK